jgi:hypothetical protein
LECENQPLLVDCRLEIVPEGADMDFWGTILVLLRRWYITLPVFVLAVLATGAVYFSRPVQYVSSSVLLLTAPTTGATQYTDLKHPAELTNPLLNFDQGLSDDAALLVHALSAPEVYSQLGVSPLGDPTFQVTNGSNNPELLINSPFVFITAQSTSPGKVQGLITQVAQRARQELAKQEREVKAPPSTSIVISEAIPPTIPQRLSGTRLRPALTALAGGVIASIAAAFAGESIMTRPGRRRNAQPPPDGFAERAIHPGGTGPDQAGRSAAAAAQRPLDRATLGDQREA